MPFPQRRSSRRAFLAGRSALDAIEDIADSWDQLDPPDAPPGSGSMPPAELQLQVSREAMACEFEVFFDTIRYQHGTDASLKALDLIEELEAQLTVYRPESEVSLLNATAASSPVRVEPQLLGLLQRAVELSQLTGGAFDITSAPLSKVWGFHRRQGRVPSEADLHEALATVGSQHLQFNATRRTVAFDRRGLEINLGSIGKGYALDRAASELQQLEVHDFLIHGGASSILAVGSSTDMLPTETPGWTVGIRHPARPGKRLLEIVLQNKALGTSGSAVQHFHHQGKKYGHIIDPRTGWPAEVNLSSTVVAPTAAEADALATAFFVMRLAEIERFCKQQPQVGALIVTAGARHSAIELHAFNLDDTPWQQLAD